MIISLVSVLLILVAVAWLTPKVSSYIMEHTSAYTYLTDKCAQMVQRSAEEKDTTEETLDDNLSGLGLPSVLVKQISKKAGDTLQQKISESGIYVYVGGCIAEWILLAIAFLVTFVLVSVAFSVFMFLLKIVDKLPVFHGANHFLGATLGLVQGLLLVWLILFLIMLLYATNLGQTLLACVEESVILRTLYGVNPIPALLGAFWS